MSCHLYEPGILTLNGAQMIILHWRLWPQWPSKAQIHICRVALGTHALNYIYPEFSVRVLCFASDGVAPDIFRSSPVHTDVQSQIKAGLSKSRDPVVMLDFVRMDRFPLNFSLQQSLPSRGVGRVQKAV